MITTAEGTVSISTEVWEKKLGEYAQQVGKTVREALYEEWPLLMRKVMDFTPPFKAKGQRGISDLSVGRAAVAGDIYKTMQPFDPKEVRSPHLKKIIQERDIAGFNAVAARSKNGLMKGATAVAFSPDIHIRARNYRGRVTGEFRNVRVLGSDAVLLIAYVKETQGRVGTAKSGWLAALMLVGGDAPGYVSKQGTGMGDVVDDHANEDNPSITAINRSPWAVRKDEGDRILSDAYASRIESIIAKMKAAERLAMKAAELAAA